MREVHGSVGPWLWGLGQEVALDPSVNSSLAELLQIVQTIGLRGGTRCNPWTACSAHEKKYLKVATAVM